MSFFAIATRNFDAMIGFYAEGLNLSVSERFERPGARGAFIDLGGGSRMELIDANAQKRPMAIGDSSDDRLSIVIETENIEEFGQRAKLPSPEQVSWGARVIRLKDPDGIGVWILQWDEPRKHVAE